MRNGWLGVTLGADGGANRGGGTRALKLMMLSILLIVLSAISLADYGRNLKRSHVNLDKQIPFKCTHCNEVAYYKIRELQKMFKPTTRPGTSTRPGEGFIGPMMGPMVLDCPKCHQKTLTQAVECPKCGEIFVMKMDPTKNMFDDKCPKCHESYAKAWQEKYRKEQKSD